MNLPSWASRPIPAAAATAAPPLLPHDGGIGAGLLAALLDEFDLGVIVCDAHARLRLANHGEACIQAWSSPIARRTCGHHIG